MARGNSVANWDLDDPYLYCGDEDSDEDVTGYECSGCGNVQYEEGECDCCTGFCTEPIYN